MPNEPLTFDARAWDDEYRTGRWNYLADAEQAPRYAVIADWCRRFSPSAKIVDAGCGEGLLLEHLGHASFAHYHGIDFAPAAIDRARSRIRDSAREHFQCASLEDLDPSALTPDVVVFNESLYCCRDPLRLFRRYLGAVGNGLVVVSITAMQEVLASLLERMYEERIIASLTITDRRCLKGWRLLAVSADGSA
ncbi:MAG: class I SAM-dependent methyltransferase [Thermoanaerobaculia bacterium]